MVESMMFCWQFANIPEEKKRNHVIQDWQAGCHLQESLFAGVSTVLLQDKQWQKKRRTARLFQFCMASLFCPTEPIFTLLNLDRHSTCLFWPTWATMQSSLQHSAPAVYYTYTNWRSSDNDDKGTVIYSTRVTATGQFESFTFLYFPSCKSTLRESPPPF